MIVETVCIAGLFIVVPLIIIILAGLRVVKEYERGVIFRLGKFIRIQKPGLFYLIPVIDQMIKTDLRVMTVDVPKQDAITSDNVPVEVNAVIYFKVSDPELAILKVENYHVAVAQAAQTTLRSIIGQFSLDELLSKKEQINKKLKIIIDKMSDPWGIKVDSVETKEVVLPRSMQRAMAKQAEAERERRARLIKAKAELEATRKLKEAGKMIREQPSILELRRMQMVSEVGAEKNSTTVILMPSDFLTAADMFSKWAKDQIERK